MEIHFNKALSKRQFFYKDSFTGQFKLYETQDDVDSIKYQTFDYFFITHLLWISRTSGRSFFWGFWWSYFASIADRN